MDAKDLRTEAALGDRNDGNTKYAQIGSALPCHRSKAYQDIGSNSLGKVDAATTRPCAVIGPDRVVPPPASTDAYLKKGPTEPWLGPDNTYRRPPEYPHKLIEYQLPSRNISPRQTFQENMQRIMVPPSYATVKMKEDHNFPGDPNVLQLRNNKMNVSMDSNSKYCDVPYINPMLNEQKNLRNSDISGPNVNNVLTRSAPHRWPTSSANVRPTKPYPQEICQYPEYPSCAGPRPMVMPRPNRSVHDESGPVYSEAYYHEGNVRFKPYPTVKERYPQSRYEYITNYPNPFHPPPPFPSHKYDMQKPMPPHPYPGYSQVPLKYLDGRMPDPIMNGYQRSLNPQVNYNNIPYRNQIIHPSYGGIPANCIQTNKFYPYPPEVGKPLPPNKLPYTDASGKIYSEYEGNRPKNFHMSEGYYVNEIRPHSMKGPSLPPNYPTNIHAIPPHPFYRKEVKGYEYNPNPQFRGIDPSFNINGNLLSRFPTQFSPTAIAISPSDSNTSNDTNQTQGTSQEDFGYVSQSSTASIRSIDSGMNRIPPEFRRYDPRYAPIIKSTATSKQDNTSSNTKDKKDIDVRQFLQMWNEGEEENGENNSKEVVIKTVSNNFNEISNNLEASSQEQLYVLGLVNVPSEELAKYEHIQKVSKLPENIKGYNNIELLHQFEEIIESSNLNYSSKPATPKDYHNPLKNSMPVHGISIPSRPLSPLDVEAKISQSVIHKEVGCNFEIKPCSPKMLNVEIAAPVQSVLAERIIEKVSNPLIGQSPILQSNVENRDSCNVILDRQDQVVSPENTKVASCKMVNPQYNNETIDIAKTNYSIQDLESNSGVCLASLPRLDNDIELNFPEVNQQFINANKVESVITATSVKDLPPIDADPCESEPKFNQSTTNSPVEKDFSKLSKYRKLKRKGPDSHNLETNVQALRTDSVIIKNPDNFKTHERNLDKSPSPKVNLIETQCDPINLSVTTESRQVSDEQGCYEIKAIPNILDKAIDFSRNTNDSNEKPLEISNTSPKESTKQGSICLEMNQNFSGVVEEMNALQEDETVQNILGSDTEDSKLAKMSDSENAQMSPGKDDCSIYFPNQMKTRPPNSSQKLELITKSGDCLSETSCGEKPKEFDDPIPNSKNITFKHSTPEYCLSETEDSINMKMRELFGELSVPEPDSDPNVSRKILEDDVLASIDDVVSNKIYPVQKGSNLDNKESDFFLNQNKDKNYIENPYIDERNYSESLKETEIRDNQKGIRKSIFDIDYENIVELNETPKNSKTIEKGAEVIDERRQTNHCQAFCSSALRKKYVYKELLSPWIQKLILYSVGFCATTNENDLQGQVCDDFDSKSTGDSTGAVAQECNNVFKSAKNSLSYDQEENSSKKEILDFDTEYTTNLEYKCITGTILPINPITETYVDKNTETSDTQLNENSNTNYAQENVVTVVSPKINENLSCELEITNNIQSTKHEEETLLCRESKMDSSFIKYHEESLENNDEKGDSGEKEIKMSHNCIEGLGNSICDISSSDVETMEGCDIVSNLKPIKDEIEKLNKEDCVIENMDMETDVSNCALAIKDKEVVAVTTDESSSIIDNTLNKKPEEIIANQLNKPNNKPNNDIPVDHITSGITKVLSENDKETIDEMIDVNNCCQNGNEECTPNIINNLTFNDKITTPNYENLVHDDEAITEGVIDTIKPGDNLDCLQNSEIKIEQNESDSNVCRKKSYIDLHGSNSDSTQNCDATSIDKTLNESTLDNNTDDTEILNVDVSNSNKIFNKIETNGSADADTITQKTDTDYNVPKSDTTNSIFTKDKCIKYEVNSDEINSFEDSLQEQEVARDLSSESGIIMSEVCSKDRDTTSESTSNNEIFVDEDCSKKRNINSVSTSGETIVSDVCSKEQDITSAIASDSTIIERSECISTALGAPNEKDSSFDNDAVSVHEGVFDSGVVDDDSVFEDSAKEIRDLKNSLELGIEKEINYKYSPLCIPRKRSLKRSLSETALDEIRDDSNDHDNSYLRPHKRKKKLLDCSNETQLFAENICQVLQNHRRNSMSSMHNEENVSFCILIDNNCIITEDCEDSDKICFSEVPEDCIACVQEDTVNDTAASEVVQYQEGIDYEYSTSLNNDFDQEEKSLDEPWVDDVACVETVVSDNIAEDIIINASTSPRDSGSECEQSENESYENEHSEKLKYIYGDKMHSEDARFVDTLYRTPQMNVNQTLSVRESQIVEDCGRCYDNESLEQILSNSLSQEETTSNRMDFECTSPLPMSSPEYETPEDSSCSVVNTESHISNTYNSELPSTLEYKEAENLSPLQDQKCADQQDCVTIDSGVKLNANDSCESSSDSIFSNKLNDESLKCEISSSPEVSSTTSEEKCSGILLKITNYSGSRVAQVNDVSPITSISCKYTEKKEYLSTSNKQYLNPNLSARTLITKAAQKYIPPLKETIPDLKVKLPLPAHSLTKLRELKIAKGMPKLSEDNKTNIPKKECPKKAKPKFEDVLKSIDEIQYQMHKDKSKKVRKIIPKVVIKKNENGSHYASTSSQDRYNPDLTGRKWQPWVFLEKNSFIDKMALKRKTRAIFSHRKKIYVLAEKFHKYKSANSTKFVISQPKFEDSPSGHLKYTIRLKHHY